MEYREFRIFRLSVNELQKSLFEELNSIAPIPVCTCSSTKWKVRSHSRLVAICFTCSSKCLIQILLLTSARRYDFFAMCAQWARSKYSQISTRYEYKTIIVFRLEVQNISTCALAKCSSHGDIVPFKRFNLVAIITRVFMERTFNTIHAVILCLYFRWNLQMRNNITRNW